MKNEELLHDLKQFITATVSQTVSQAVSESEQRLNAKLVNVEARLSDLDAKVDTIHDAIADTFTKYAASADGRLENHEQRLRRLERRMA